MDRSPRKPGALLFLRAVAPATLVHRKVHHIGAWAVFTGVFEIIAAIQLRKEIGNEWAIGLSGLISVVFGLVVMIFPGDGAVALVWVIGIYAILFGIALIAAGIRLRGWRNDLRDTGESPAR